MKWWGLPAKIWMSCFILMPFLWMVFLSFQPHSRDAKLANLGWHQFSRVIAPPYNQIILDSVALSFFAALFVLALAVPLVWNISRLPPRRRKTWLALFTIPLGLNFVVRIYAWFVLFRPEGFLGRLLVALGIDTPLVSSQTGVFWGLVYGYLPVIFLPLYSVFEKLDRSQLEAAQDLGAHALQRWWHIILPSTRSGLMASFLFIYVPMLGEYLIPRMIGGGLVANLGTQIEGQFLGSGRPNWPFGAALSLTLLAAAVAVLLLSHFLLSRSQRRPSQAWPTAQTA
ncbi:MAG: hypothetical protein RIR26_2628 [Pseudomonadota bacterium]